METPGSAPLLRAGWSAEGFALDSEWQSGRAGQQAAPASPGAFLFGLGKTSTPLPHLSYQGRIVQVLRGSV